MQLPFTTLVAVLTSTVFAASQYASKPYSQEALDQFNVLRFLGTSSPFIQNTGFGIEREAPSTCNVTQASVIARHGERYPTASKGKTISGKLERIRSLSNDDITGALSFLPEYEFVGLDKERYDTETNRGPYSGLADMYRFGAEFRNRYNDLYEAVEDKDTFKFYTASQQRVVDSATKFAEGFLGTSLNTSNLIIIDEDDESLGANSLTPATSCLSYNTTINDDLVDEYSSAYKKTIAARFNSLSPELEINRTEVGALLDYMGFDLNVAGLSTIAELFTTSELAAYAYGNDLDYYYNKGPGNNLSSIVGSAFVGGIIKALKDDELTLTVSFAHDSDLFPIYSVLGLFDGELTTDYVDFRALWKTSQLAPMGGHIIFERLECEDEDSDFLRIIVNDAVIPIPGLSDGPGYSAAVEDVESFISEKLGNTSYAEDCDLEDGAPTEFNVFWDYN